MSCTCALIGIAKAQAWHAGKAWGCAKAFSEAKAAIDGYIAVFASAVASAHNVCPGCDPKAVSSIWTALAAKITAEAEVNVKSAVCVGPDQSASAKAFAMCHAQTLAHGFAQVRARCSHSMLSKLSRLPVATSGDEEKIVSDGTGTMCMSVPRSDSRQIMASTTTLDWMSEMMRLSYQEPNTETPHSCNTHAVRWQSHFRGRHHCEAEIYAQLCKLTLHLQAQLG